MPPSEMPKASANELADTWENWARQRVRELYAESDQLRAAAKELLGAVEQYQTIRRIGRLP